MLRRKEAETDNKKLQTNKSWVYINNKKGFQPYTPNKTVCFDHTADTRARVFFSECCL